MTAVEVRLEGEPPLPLEDGLLATYRVELDALDRAAGTPPPPCRLAFAAAHLVMDEGYAAFGHGPETPGDVDEIAAQIDWETTFALRRRLASHGLGIAEAMDTAQRYQTGWKVAQRLIEGTGALGLPHGWVAGASTDHLESLLDPEHVAEGWAWQANRILAAGGTPVLLPQPSLTAWRLDAEAFVAVYRTAVASIDGPLYLHWLGEAFHPAMRGYFPGDSFERVLALDAEKIRGAKLSLLDADFERRTRRALRDRGQLVLTGDDLHFASLIGGDGPNDFSHALLGVLDAVAAPAGLALRFLAHGRRDRFDALMAPCEELGRALFEPPTDRYQAGLAFLAWLNGWQENRMLVNRADLGRDREHLLRVARLASAAGCLEDAALAADRIARLE